ncbi:MAG: polysaccharide biosynthesis/export family protein [Candidatus Margulisiibacteriota bacterium]|nr:polysaccharide biosynthesis/export family protein [Candidatus Margulisiibacteriota bacterium]
MKRFIAVFLIILHSFVISHSALGIEREYVLGPYDMLEVEIINHPELKTKQTVTPDGQASLPLLGVVSVEGKTLKGLHDFLTTNYAAYIEKPQLTINLTPKPIYVIQYDLRKDTWEVKKATSIDEAKALTGIEPTLAIEHGNVYKVSMGKKADWLEDNWYKVITATAVMAGIYSTLK